MPAQLSQVLDSPSSVPTDRSAGKRFSSSNPQQPVGASWCILANRFLCLRHTLVRISGRVSEAVLLANDKLAQMLPDCPQWFAWTSPMPNAWPT
jgi:hypothetical protein